MGTGYECRKCGYEPSEDEVRKGVCPMCNPREPRPPSKTERIAAAVVDALNTPSILQSVNEALGAALERQGLGDLNTDDSLFAIDRFEARDHGAIAFIKV